jgi:hypothetical protein
MRKKLIAASAFLCAALAAQAQNPPAARPDDNASMVRPPGAPGSPAASAARPHNPDNMPVKRPNPPPNSDRMLHNSPASDAIAK